MTFKFHVIARLAMRTMTIFKDPWTMRRESWNSSRYYCPSSSSYRFM